MAHFVHLSDPHLTPLQHVAARDLLGKRLLGFLSWQRRRRFRHLPQLLRLVTADALQSAPEHFAITGDLTQIGLPAEHVLAEQWLRSLGDPAHVSLSPGNHDFYARSSTNSVYANWSSYLHGRNGWPIRRDCGDMSFISLNSGTPSGAAFATGRLGAQQLQRLPAALDEARGRYRVLLVHHSPHPQGHHWRKRLTDAAALRAIVDSCGAELILHGHAHSATLEWLELANRRVPVLGAPSASLQSRDPAHRAGYHRIQVSRLPGNGPDRTPGGTDDQHAPYWATEIETRQCIDGRLQTSARHAFNLPVA